MVCAACRSGNLKEMVSRYGAELAAEIIEKKDCSTDLLLQHSAHTACRLAGAGGRHGDGQSRHPREFGAFFAYDRALAYTHVNMQHEPII